jgi:hypothetical protein
MQDLHDATPVSVRLDWATGTVVLELRTDASDAGRMHLIAADTTELLCPRQLPWGPSVSINEVRGPVAHGNTMRVEIEMQSGDVLRIEARSITFAPVVE